MKMKTYIRCKKCQTEIFYDTKKKLTPCKCGAISVDGCEDYVRVNGNEADYEHVRK